MNLVDDEEEPGGVFLKLTEGVVVLGPQPLAAAVAPRLPAFSWTAGVGWQPVAVEVGSDPCQSAGPSGRVRISLV